MELPCLILCHKATGIIVLTLLTQSHYIDWLQNFQAELDKAHPHGLSDAVVAIKTLLELIKKSEGVCVCVELILVSVAKKDYHLYGQVGYVVGTMVTAGN